MPSAPTAAWRAQTRAANSVAGSGTTPARLSITTKSLPAPLILLKWIVRPALAAMSTAPSAGAQRRPPLAPHQIAVALAPARQLEALSRDQHLGGTRPRVVVARH